MFNSPLRVYDIETHKDKKQTTKKPLGNGVSMPQFVFSDPVDLNPEDEVSVETEIRAGSTVVFERKGKNRVIIRALPFNDIQEYGGAIYTVARGIGRERSDFL